MTKHFSFLLFVLLLVISQTTSAQTPISGGIYSNTTWTLANSPYLITSAIVVFPGNTLTIEPGVKIKVQANINQTSGISDTYLEIRGNLVAVGTPNAPIIFTTDSINSPNYVPVYTPYEQWYGITIKSLQGATASFNYVTIDHSGYGINNQNDSSTVPLVLKGCTFSNNTWGLNMYGPLELDSCYFINNYYPLKGDPIYGMSAINCVFNDNESAIPYYGAGSNFENCSFNGNAYAIQNSAGGIVNNCTFSNNEYAFYNVYGNYTITNCTFTNNATAILLIENSSISDCQFTNNGLGIGVGSGMSVQNCEISNNQVGIKTWGQFVPGQVIMDVKDNQICNNNLYNVENGTDLNLGLEKNCFCTSDSTLIESLIYDGYDNITLGLYNYAIYDSACQNIISYVTKVNLGTTAIENEAVLSPFTLSPNPAATTLKVETQNPEMFNSSLQMIDMNGRIMKSNLSYTGNSATIDISDLPQGVYILIENASANRQLFVKE